MNDFIIEFFNEEFPASFLKESACNIKNLIKNGLNKENIYFEKEEYFFTPKRIVVIFRNLKYEVDIKKSLIKGPSYKSSETAVKGFAKSFNTSKDKLIIKNTEKGKYYFFKDDKKPNVSSLIISVLEKELLRLNWKKSMKWGSNNLRWARPLKNILCLYKNKKLSFVLDHISSSNYTLAYNYQKDNKYKVSSINEYFKLMDKLDTVLNQEDRIKKIISDGKKIIKNKNLFMEQDEKLLSEVSNLVEKPYLFVAKFRKNYLKLPEEILKTTMKKNQKYFPLYDSRKKLSNYFLLVSNIKSNDKGKSIVEGNQRVINARLEDAVFFWNRDINKKTQYYFNKLNKIIFHNELGTIQQKVYRLKLLGKFVADTLKLEKNKENNFLAAIELLKNDLGSELVKEFPELQGIMGAYYAKYKKFNNNVCDAIYEQYKPLGPNDSLPKTDLGKLVSLIDKMDTLSGFFIIGRKPTSTKDPFALRRTALGIIRIILEGKINLNLFDLIKTCLYSYEHNHISFETKKNNTSNIIAENILKFILERYENLIKEEELSFSKSNIMRCLKVNFDEINLLNLNNNLVFLNNYFQTEYGAKLLNAIKRVINIIDLKQDNNTFVKLEIPDKKLFETKEEKILYEKIIVFSSEKILDYKILMKKLSLLILPIENFFDNVKINHQNIKLKNNRLLLLSFVNDRITEKINFFNLIKGN